MSILFGLIFSVAGAGCFYLVYKAWGKKTSGPKKEEVDEILGKAESIISQGKELLDGSSRFLSQKQFEFIKNESTVVKKELSETTAALKDIESKLDIAQTNVEEREKIQQDIKSAKQEDEARLHELLATYSDIYSESVGLEQTLASSLKMIDGVMTETELTQDQKSIFEELARILETSGARLRDLLLEYETTKQRLDMLKQQHEDLEMEYTKLIDQQLGG